MPSLNRVLLMGHLTRDVELKHTPSGTAVGAIGLAVNHTYKGKDGQKKEEVCFVDCEAFGKTAEIAAQYLAKGRAVFIEGRLKLDQWEDKSSGAKRSKLKVVVDGLQFVGDGKKTDGAPAKPNQAKPVQRPDEEEDMDFDV